MSGDIIVGAAEHARDWLDYWTFGATAGGVAVLVGYTIAAFWQARLTRKSLTLAQDSKAAADAATLRSNEATEKSNEIAERSLIIGRRAWLIPEVGPISPVPSSNDERAVVLYVLNYGRVPAVTVRYCVHGDRGTTVNADLDFPAHKYQTAGMIIPPGMVIPPEAQGLPRKLIAWIPRIQEEGEIVRVYCHIEYTDIFEKSWETKLCWWRRGSGEQWYIAPRFCDLK